MRASSPSRLKINSAQSTSSPAKRESESGMRTNMLALFGASTCVHSPRYWSRKERTRSSSSLSGEMSTLNAVLAPLPARFALISPAMSMLSEFVGVNDTAVFTRPVVAPVACAVGQAYRAADAVEVRLPRERLHVLRRRVRDYHVLEVLPCTSQLCF